MLSVDIADGHDLHTLISEERTHVAGALTSNTDAGEADFAIWRNGASTTKDGGWKNEWRSGSKELSAVGGHG